MFLRVFGVFGSLLLSLTVLYGVLIIPLQRDSLLKVLYSQATTVSRSIIQASSDAMLTDDFGFIVEHNLQVLRNNQSIQSVLIVPRRGTAMRIAPSGWEMLETDTVRLKPADFDVESYGIIQTTGGTSRYRYTAPIRFSGVSWGAIRIDFDTSEYEANIAQMYRQLLTISGLSVLVILPIGYFFALWLTRPIATISAAASRVAQGDLDAQVEIDRNDEIGQLSRSFNQMVAALAENRLRLENVNLDLEIKVAERTQALDELNRTLDQRVRDEIAKRKEQEQLLIHQSRLAAMGEMIGAIAHQWRQPLNALSLVLQNIGMQFQVGRLTEESMTRLQEKGEAMVMRMSTTIDDFRNFFKPNKHAENFNLLVALHGATDILEGVFRNHNIVVNIDCDPSIEVYGYVGEFSQVVLNILGNAKDALLISGQVAPVIRVRVEASPGTIVIRFEDNGGGMDETTLHKIFEPYFTTKEEGKGTGIGLYMSKMIIENSMHGRLEAATIKGGAIFSVTLPRQAPKQDA
ncbi:MAG: HAMP domain-containing protein [Hydrogenophilales bacterium]|nr:HAMP domain-containing protein [Hydrogenophilales bacterium]